jgi:hypothetical protein
MNYFISFRIQKQFKLLLGCFILLFLNSCYSYKITNKEFRHLKKTDSKETVYILNPSLQKEYKILEYSNLFNITEDSTKTDLKIKLYPLRSYPTCGNPLMAQVFTLGQMPVSLPNNYEFQYDQIRNGKVTSEKINLGVTQRYWFWDIFTFNRNFEKKAGKVLLGESKFKQK